ncbi:hypothetical protein [Phocoenobacter skyensis]|uniref:hypothetical protein n=1 Tax=Phocoenobacter skyensis TaxID=97481 RepID=UPI00274750E4|nr:hypothetical protein [Pasteurella skyensis]MDP8185307.1 hypothetical protein [Pasteurella skyensis]
MNINTLEKENEDSKRISALHFIDALLNKTGIKLMNADVVSKEGINKKGYFPFYNIIVIQKCPQICRTNGLQPIDEYIFKLLGYFVEFKITELGFSNSTFKISVLKLGAAYICDLFNIPNLSTSERSELQKQIGNDFYTKKLIPACDDLIKLVEIIEK